MATPTETANLTRDDRARLHEEQVFSEVPNAEPAAPPTVIGMAHTPWLLRLSESRVNYWATYVVDLSLMLFFLGWDVLRLRVGATEVMALFVAGMILWTFSEYAFHRWAYHMGFAMTRRRTRRPAPVVGNRRTLAAPFRSGNPVTSGGVL